MKQYKTSLFIFRRDLHIEDNTALYHACETSEKVIVAFIFDPKQKNHEYFSQNSFNFLLALLKKLQNDIITYKGKIFF